MRVDVDGLPKVGTQSKCLGVREPPAQHADVDTDEEGNVLLNRKGLSVSKDWRDLQPYLIPQHLNDGCNGACGKGMRVFVHGTGAFNEGAVASGLTLLHKERTTEQGVVAPSLRVPLMQFQQDLAATRRTWVIDES
jgi:hypothetical protein